jgi:hypothetical protein
LIKCFEVGMSPELIRKEFKNKKRRTLTKSNNRKIDLSVVCKRQLYQRSLIYCLITPHSFLIYHEGLSTLIN